ncbi:hypothetical protein ACP4OV_030904 [Aristida adscensionis]
MATAPNFLWASQASPAAASFDSDIAGFAAGSQLDTAQTALAAPELGAVARPRLRRQPSSGPGKQQQKQACGAGKKPPQRGLGVAELERLRCGGDPLRELAVVGDACAAVHHPLLHYHHHHHPVPAPGAHYCSSMLLQPSAPAPPPSAPPAPVCFLHSPAAGGQRAPPQAAPEQQCLRDRWGRMGGFAVAGNGVACGDHHAQLLPAVAPEHPSSQSTIWRPAPSSCLHTGRRCDLCSRTVRALAERGTTLPPTATRPPSPATIANSSTATDCSIYELAAAMATAGQGEAFLVRERERKLRGASADEAPAKTKEVREIEFFPAAAGAHHEGVGASESEFAAPFSSSPPYGGASPPLDLSLRL